MKVTLVDIQRPEELLQLLDTFEAPVLCGGVDLRNSPVLKRLICGMAAPGQGIPQLELTVSAPGDISHLLRYMRDGESSAA